MKLYLPDNIFAKLYASHLKGNNEIIYLPSAMLAKYVSENENSAALIPPTDLLNHKNLFVSGKTGISFEGEISNSYMYFKPGESHLKEISLFGDVSSLEVILTKIILKEIYNTEVSINILTDDSNLEKKNLVVTGDRNFTTGIFSGGISYSDEVNESLNLPFVNYIAVSSSQELIKELNELSADISRGIYTAIENGMIDERLNDTALSFFKEHTASLIYELDEQDVEGITQLVRLPYFYGITKDLFEINFA